MPLKYLFTIFFLLPGVLLLSQTKNFTILGRIQGVDSKPFRVYIKDTSAPHGFFMDSIPVKADGYFAYSTHLNDVTYFSIWPGVDKVMKKVKSGGFIPVKSSQLQFIGIPGSKMFISGKITDFVDAYPSGNPANDDLAKLNKEINPILNENANLMIKVDDSSFGNPILLQKAKEKMEKMDSEVIMIKRNFIKDNPSSIAAAWLLSDMMVRSDVSNEEAIELFKNLDKEKLVSVPFYIEVAKRVDGITATKTGSEAPDISTAHTYSGKVFDLKSLRGKYVIVDFWGTWCGPCVSGMPKMKEYLDKYKGRLDIVGVAQESDNGERWREFLNKNKEYNWHQVLNREDNDYVLKFSVAGFPTKIIVDPTGKIVKRFVGEDDAIYNKLDELLK